jgi:type II secretory pathway component GspD/PulD (secretin)
MLRPVWALILLAGLPTALLQAQSTSPSAAASAPAADQTPSQASSQTSSQAPSQAQPSAPSSAASFQSTPTTDAAKLETKKKPDDGIKTGKPARASTIHAQRKAAKLYLEGVRLLEKQEPEPAWDLLKQAVELAPDNATYLKAAELARQSTVTQLVQQSSRERGGGASEDAVTLLQRAQAIDPTSPLVLEHINQLADDVANTKIGTTANAALGAQAGLANDQETLADGPIVLLTKDEKHSFHLHSNTRQVLQDVFRAYGIEATLHDSVQSKPVRMDIDDATFAEAMRALEILTQTFYEPLDPHRVLVAKDTRENRTQFQRQQLETIYLPGLNDKELQEALTVAKNVFDVQQAVNEPNSSSLTVKAPTRTLAAFNKTMALLEDGKSEIDLNVKVIEVAHVSDRETGVTAFQQTSVYNVYSEINSVLSQNQSLVQEVISAGLVANDTTLANQVAILAILVASGELTGTPFNSGFLPFGGGLTQNILSPGPATLTMSLNSSDTRTLDDIHLQLADQEEGTYKIGERYPIETSSYSSVALPTTSALSTTAAAAAQTIPQIQYQDIGLTLKVTPKVLRTNDVALTLSLKISALGGTALNDIPILNNQEASGVLTVKDGETAVLLNNLSRSESRALSGTPGISDIPGLEDISDITKDQNVARLLILVTPTVTRNIQQAGHGPMLMVDKATPSSHSYN